MTGICVSCVRPGYCVAATRPTSAPYTPVGKWISCDGVEMLSGRWKIWVALSSLVSVTCLVVACSESKSSSGGAVQGSDAATDVGMQDAAPPDASTPSDASTQDGPACPLLGQAPSCYSSFAPPGTPASSAQTFDEALSYGCAHPHSFAFVDASFPCVFSPGGLLGIYQFTGTDTADVEFFDPSTRHLVEVGRMVGSTNVMCSCSVSGVAADCWLNGFVCGPCTDAGTSDAPADTTGE